MTINENIIHTEPEQLPINYKALKTKGKASILLEWRIFEAAKHYTRLTVRQLYYILISRYGYNPSRKFYKILDYHLTKLRRVNKALNAKFLDPTRHFIRAPRPYHEVELWVEKDSVRNFLNDLAAKYRLSIQVLKGFASLSMYRKALLRAAERGVKKILYIGDFDPSGLLIEKVAEKEMNIEVVRIALTIEQVNRFKPPSLPVNMRDSRAKDYVAIYGDRCWELEALRPRTLFRLIEVQLRENVPAEFLVEAEAREKAAKVARPLTERMRRVVEKEVRRQLEAGVSEEQILSDLASKYGLRLRKTGKKRGTANGEEKH